MPVNRTIQHNSEIFFTTFTNHEWLQQIDRVIGYNIVYNRFDYLETERK